MSDLAKAFAGLKKPEEPERLSTQDPKLKISQGLKVEPRTEPAPAESTAKSRDPDYTPVKVFLRKKTHKAAGRKWEDEQEQRGSDGDFSDLVEQLLQEYLSA